MSFEIDDPQEIDEFLEHFGVKGMHWGSRKGHLPGVSTRTNREAAKDATEFVRAKMFFGEGAGTRRKLINKSIEDKAKRDPNYKKAFDHHLGNQNVSTHAEKARKERKSIDRSTRTKQQASYLTRRFTGQQGTQAAFVAAGLAGAAYLSSPKVRAFMGKAGKKIKDLPNDRRAKAGTKYLVDYFKRNS